MAEKKHVGGLPHVCVPLYLMIVRLFIYIYIYIYTHKL